MAQAARDREQAQKDRDAWQATQEWMAQAQRTAPAAARPAAPALRAAPPPRPAAEKPKTHVMTIINGDEVTRVTFAKQDAVQPAAPESFQAPANSPPLATPSDPSALRQLVRQNQERVRQQILQTRQQMMQKTTR
jgi:hypothetical protein